jgi:hypothetical protein
MILELVKILLCLEDEEASCLLQHVARVLLLL